MRGTWRGPGLPREARVEALEEGWIWGSPMPDGSFACIACVDTPSDYFALLAKSLLFRELRNGERVAASGEREMLGAPPSSLPTFQSFSLLPALAARLR